MWPDNCSDHEFLTKTMLLESQLANIQNVNVVEQYSQARSTQSTL